VARAISSSIRLFKAVSSALNPIKSELTLVIQGSMVLVFQVSKFDIRLVMLARAPSSYAVPLICTHLPAAAAPLPSPSGSYSEP
jgi:hypothetical protein